jgi:hypothetical protein
MLRRTPLKARSTLARRTPLRTKAPIKAKMPSAPKARIQKPKAPPKDGARLVCEPHLAWVRSLACAVRMCRTRGCDPHHVRKGTDGGTGRKPGDQWVVPLCHLHHMELHNRGQLTFEATHGVRLAELAVGLWASSPTGRS